MTTVEDTQYMISSEGVGFARSQSVQVDPNYNIEWCVTRPLENELKARGVINPQLLIVVTHADKEVDRFLAPLGAMKAHIVFAIPDSTRFSESLSGIRKVMSALSAGTCLLETIRANTATVLFIMLMSTWSDLLPNSKMIRTTGSILNIRLIV